jgi:hypothetical protein
MIGSICYIAYAALAMGCEADVSRVFSQNGIVSPPPPVRQINDCKSGLLERGNGAVILKRGLSKLLFLFSKIPFLYNTEARYEMRSQKSC